MFLGTALEWVFQVRLGIQEPNRTEINEWTTRGGSVHGGTVGTQSNGGRRNQLNKFFSAPKLYGFLLFGWELGLLQCPEKRLLCTCV